MDFRDEQAAEMNRKEGLTEEDVAARFRKNIVRLSLQWTPTIKKIYEIEISGDKEK